MNTKQLEGYVQRGHHVLANTEKHRLMSLQQLVKAETSACELTVEPANEVHPHPYYRNHFEHTHTRSLLELLVQNLPAFVQVVVRMRPSW